MLTYQTTDIIYENPLSSPQDIKDWRMEGSGVTTFPLSRMRMESTRPEQERQAANIVLWCPESLPDNIEISWNFMPIREPGLAILFFAAKGRKGEDIFDPALVTREGPYKQYNRGDINALHVSYFRRNPMPERFGWGENQFQTCNLRKSYGFHLVAQGMDGIPTVLHRAYEAYRIKIVKVGPDVDFYIKDVMSFCWHDDGETYGPVLTDGKIGFRQMAPLIAEYSNLTVRKITID